MHLVHIRILNPVKLYKEIFNISVHINQKKFNFQIVPLLQIHSTNINRDIISLVIIEIAKKKKTKKKHHSLGRKLKNRHIFNICEKAFTLQ